ARRRRVERCDHSTHAIASTIRRLGRAEDMARRTRHGSQHAERSGYVLDRRRGVARREIAMSVADRRTNAWPRKDAVPCCHVPILIVCRAQLPTACVLVPITGLV